MIVYRIAKAKYIEDLSGYGAYLVGGRWTLPGTYALYTAQSRSLAYLEFLVHQVDRDVWPSDIKIATISVKQSKDILSLEPKALPVEWEQMIYHTSVQSVGSHYLSNGASGVQVPSAIVPGEQNLVINPDHKRFEKEVKIIEVEDLRLDQRFNRSNV